MRLENIETLKVGLGSAIQDIPKEHISDPALYPFRFYKSDPFKRSVSRFISFPVLKAMQRFFLKRTKCEFPFKYDLLCVGDRFAEDSSLSIFVDLLKKNGIRQILVGGCSRGGEDVQFWLRRKFSRVDGVDIEMDSRWAAITNELKKYFGAEVEFRQGLLERLPYKDNEISAITTQATLEHVRNLNVSFDEMARVMRPGAYARHSFGPLYFSHGGDHCIGTYGFENGYAHLTESEEAYRAMIQDDSYFKKHTPHVHCNAWAIYDQFSFLKPHEYIAIFKTRFTIENLVLVISEEALRFREAFPDKWTKLLDAGVDEASLLIKGMHVILRKKSGNPEM